MQCNMTPWNDMPQNIKYSLNRIYMILLRNTSRVHNPWGICEVHIPTQTISTCLCGQSQRTITKLNNPQQEQSSRAQLIIIINHSHWRSTRAQVIIIIRSKHGRSPSVRPLFILNLMSVHVNDMISKKRNDATSQ